MPIKKLLKRWKGKDDSEYAEKRSCARLVYPSLKRPKLKIKDELLDVIDISEKGIKFTKDKEQKMGECVYGSATLLCGKSIEITGKIAWESVNEVGLLVSQISESVIMAEIKALLREMGEGETEEA